MRQRGRPRHDDILTPREWEVLHLLRQGLTNEQIADRLGVTHDTAKFHVSEILGKLGVESRQDAARWAERQQETASAPGRRFMGFGALLGLPQRLAAAFTMRAVAVTVLGLAGALLIGLLLGWLAMTNRNSQEETVAQEPATPAATPTPEQSTLVHAPDGRTGDAALDSIIEALLTEDEAVLRARFGDIEVYEEAGQPASWTARLAGSERSLYAVRGRVLRAAALAPLDYEIIIATPGEFYPAAWLFGVIDGAVVRVYPPSSGVNVRDYLAGFDDDYHLYTVLPPAEDLPQPPDGHRLTVRTGDPGVDGLLAVVQANDVDALLDAVEYRREPCAGALLELDACRGDNSVEVVPATRAEPGSSGREGCRGDMSLQDAAYVQRWFREWGQPVAIHAVATIARDYEETEGQPIGGDHEIMVVLQLDRYTWQVGSLYERDGRIVAIRCRREPIYPDPREIPYIVTPPADGALPALSRRSGVGVVDAVLDAIQTSNAVALADLIDYEMVACVQESLGIGSPPVCRPDEAPGSLIRVLSSVACEGGLARLDELTIGPNATQVPDVLLDSDWRLYALLEAGPNLFFRRSEVVAVLVTSAQVSGPDGQTWPRGAAIGLSSKGVTFIAYGCGPQSPESRIDWALGPSFLLPPP